MRILLVPGKRSPAYMGCFVTGRRTTKIAVLVSSLSWTKTSTFSMASPSFFLYFLTWAVNKFFTSSLYSYFPELFDLSIGRFCFLYSSSLSPSSSSSPALTGGKLLLAPKPKMLFSPGLSLFLKMLTEFPFPVKRFGELRSILVWLNTFETDEKILAPLKSPVPLLLLNKFSKSFFGGCCCSVGSGCFGPTSSLTTLKILHLKWGTFFMRVLRLLWELDCCLDFCRWLNVCLCRLRKGLFFWWTYKI